MPNNITQFYLYAFPLTFVASDNIATYSYKDYLNANNIPVLELGTKIKPSNNFVNFYNDCITDISKRISQKTLRQKNIRQR